MVLSGWDSDGSLIVAFEQYGRRGWAWSNVTCKKLEARRRECYRRSLSNGQQALQFLSPMLRCNIGAYCTSGSRTAQEVVHTVRS